MRDGELDNTMKNALGRETSGTAPDAPDTCRFRRVLLYGLPPSKSQVEALLKSLEARGAWSRAAETAESRPQAISPGDGLAKVITFS